MKWGSEAKNDDRRCIIKYAWYPIRIQNRWSDPKIEWRWLETVKIRQEYKNYAYHIDNPFKMIYCELKIFLFGSITNNVHSGSALRTSFKFFSKSEFRNKSSK